jgi:hypothetical protein
MLRLLIAANSRNAQLPIKGGAVRVYSAKAIYRGVTLDDAFLADGVLQINLVPSRGKLPVLDVLTEKAIKNQFQPMLLMYRTRNFAKVRNSRFDLPEFASGIRVLARVLGAPIVDAPELQAGLRPLLRGQQERIGQRRWLDVRCVTIEALLALCHRGQEDDRAYVGDITATVTKILEGRGESIPLVPKAIGAMLRSEFSIFPGRDSNGYAVRLTTDIRRKIHSLARDFDVASKENPEALCVHCTEMFAVDGHGESQKDL